MKNKTVTIIGGGLAGAEAALYLAEKKIHVILYEMRPVKMTPAHQTPELGELICSNSLKSNRLDAGAGLLKAELKILGCNLLQIAERNQVKSGAALTVDREKFSKEITTLIEKNSFITLIREEITNLDKLDTPVLVATGPLISDNFPKFLQSILGEEHLYFFDAISPIISWESINKEKGFFESRYGKGDPNIFNLPMSKEEFMRFWEELTHADIIPMKNVDKLIYFESCLPVEEIAGRGYKSLLFGPLKPVGFQNEKAKNAEAILQLRPEDTEGNFFNLIGFQTRLRYQEQKRVFQMIPGLENAEFIRYGSMHRNTYINSPAHLEQNLQLKKLPGVFIGGQISGVEGYIESIMGGLLAAISIHKQLIGDEFMPPPIETITGALLRRIITFQRKFQPVNANFGILPQPKTKIRNKKQRREVQAEIALRTMQNWKNENL